jgi:hypothetical protein
MALLHATQLFTGNVVTVNPSFTTCYTVPAGDRIILRSVAVRNLSGSVGLSVYVKVAGTLVWSKALTVGGTAGDNAEWRPWVVATPAQLVQVAVSNAAGVGCVISGSIYTI